MSQEKEVKVDFSTLVVSLGSAALMAMGLVPQAQTQKIEKNLPLTKQNIDILELLQEKTKGNLTNEETKLLENILHELRSKFVATVKQNSINL